MLSKIYRDQFEKEVVALIGDILDNIVSPICGIGNIVFADLFLATLEDYGNDNEVERILRKISKKYVIDMKRFSRSCQNLWSIGSYVYLYSKLVDPCVKLRVGDVWKNPTTGILKRWNGHRWVNER